MLLSQQHQSSSDNVRSGGFESLGLSDDLITVTQSMNWDSPTPVQQLSIPAILSLATTHQHNHDDNDDDNYSSSNSLWCESPTGR
jgi:superfamily II DNA/RNA helicase